MRGGRVTETYALAIHAGHSLAGQSTIAAEDLADDTMIVRRHCEVMTETSRHFTERGVRPFFAFRSSNDEQVLAVMPASYALKFVLRPSLSGFNIKCNIGFLYAAHAEHLQHGESAMLQSVRADYLPGDYDRSLKHAPRRQK